MRGTRSATLLLPIEHGDSERDINVTLVYRRGT
jgi:hypothetical protein